MSLLDAIKAPPEIIIDRSELETFIRCPLMCKLDKENPQDDADQERMKLVGISFHDVMNDYIDELLATGERSNPGALCALATEADARFQPDLLHCAKLTGPRIVVWQGNYISHEKQYGYRLEGFAPDGRDVLLTCRPDLVLWGYSQTEIRLPDWKTGWGMDFAFQSMFYAVVVWRSIEGIESVTFSPFMSRKGTWGKPYIFDTQGSVITESLVEAENIIKSAVMQYLSEDDWKPMPGTERCRYCRHRRACPVDAKTFEIDENPEDYFRAYLKLQQEVKGMAELMKAHVKAHGPIQLDKEWFGVSVLNARPSFKVNKGTPGYVGEDTDDDAE